MKSTFYFLAAFLLLSITLLYAQPQPPEAPVLDSPADGTYDHNPHGTIMVWSQPGYNEDSFFDVFLGNDPNPQQPQYHVYGGHGSELFNGTYFTLFFTELYELTEYYYVIRITDNATNLSNLSALWHFGTGNFIGNTYTITGTITAAPGTALNGVTLTCPQDVAPTVVQTGNNGTYSFTVNAGQNPTVTPAKQWFKFNPLQRTFNNINQNWGGQNFAMTSVFPNTAAQPWPVTTAQSVSVSIGHLKWEFATQAGYAIPYEFTIYFPTAEDVFGHVSYAGGRTEYSIDLPTLTPNTSYAWKVVPVADGGYEAQYVVTWTFETGDYPVPLLLYPDNGAEDLDPEGVELAWDLPGGSYAVDSFFDVYCDIYPDFPSPPIYSGPISPSRYEFTYLTGALMEEVAYYWKVRFNALGDYWESAIRNFVTGPTPLITYSTISGTITSGGAGANGVTVSCPTACLPVQVVTGVAGTYSFWVRNGNAAAYVVTPTKQWHWFTPAFYNSPVPVNGNLVANFTMNSLVPNNAVNPWPLIHADEVVVNIPHLAWTFTTTIGYDPPDQFVIHIPHLDPDYYVVPYTGDRAEYYLPIPNPPLEYDTFYEWWVVPTNEYGEAENVPHWDFTTEEEPEPPTPPTLVYPTYSLTNVHDTGLIMVWSPASGNDPESFFDVYLDTNNMGPDLLYTGPGLINPAQPEMRFCYAHDLQLGANCSWWIVVHDPDTGMSSETATWPFSVSQTHVDPPPIALISPLDGAMDVPPGTVNLVWDCDDLMAESFFDVYFDINPIDPDDPDPAALIYSGPGVPQRTYFEWHCSAYMDQQTYYWFCRYSNWVDYWLSRSPVGQFVTGNYTPPPNPELVSPFAGAVHVTPEDVQFIWEEEEEYMTGWPDSFFDVYCDLSPMPTTSIYHGPGIENTVPYQYIWEQSLLLDEEAYYWFVRITNAISGLHSDSPVWSFTTAPAIEPGIPEQIAPPPETQLAMVTMATPPETSFPIYYNPVPIGAVVPPPPNPALNNTNSYGVVLVKAGVRCDLAVDMPSGTWWVLAYHSGAWHQAVPYPCGGGGGGGCLLSDLSFFDRGDVPVIISEGEGNDPTLPVELSSFTATCTAAQFVSLSWVVQSETNLLGYNILRNKEEDLAAALTLNTEPISEGTAAGTQISYSYLDEQVEPGSTYHYWLESVDLDGTSHFFGPVSVSISGGDEEQVPEIPTTTTLLAAFPNPFSPNTTIPYVLKGGGDVHIRVYDTRGRLVRSFSQPAQTAGYHKVVWDGRDENGRSVASGIYTYKMTSGKYTATRKFILME